MKRLPAALAASSALAFASCGDGGGTAWDSVIDPPSDTAPADTWTDTAADAPVDPAGDTAVDSGADTAEDPGADTAVTWRTCGISCTPDEDCCSAASTCGVYPDKWTCSGVCLGRGCDTDAECQAWAAGLGIAGASGYRCRGYPGGFMSCVTGCGSPADCCPSGVDCSSYPYRYLCDDGGCLMDQCATDDECRAYAAWAGMSMPDSYVCGSLAGGTWDFCVASCGVATDCCASPPCDTFPQHFDCREGLCTSFCDDTVECQAWASSVGLPDPGRYVCHP